MMIYSRIQGIPPAALGLLDQIRSDRIGFRFILWDTGTHSLSISTSKVRIEGERPEGMHG